MGVLAANDDGAAIAFGQRILALLDTGSFTASYKYAPAATLASARALYLHQPAGSPLWLGRPGRVEELDRDRLLGVLRTDIGLAADEPGSYEV